MSFSGNVYKAVTELLDKYGVSVNNVSGTEIAIFCPFHDNVNSPSCYINTKTGLWQCFNPSCGAKGNFRQLYKRFTGKDYLEALGIDADKLQATLNEALLDEEEEKGLSLDSVKIDYESDDVKLLESMVDRGFELDTLKQFEIGFSKVKNRVVIPVRDPTFKLTGLIGRAIHDYQVPKYLYNKGFRRADNLFNIQNAKRYDDVIVCEGSLDAVNVAQAGFPNVVATLGANVSRHQLAMLNKYFNGITIFSDNDEAGEKMRHAIMVGCLGKDLRWARVPDEVKDPGDMTQQEIVNAINNTTTIIGVNI